MNWIQIPGKPINDAAIDRGLKRQITLTKPPGSLGQLEQVAIKLCGMLGDMPKPDAPAIVIFAADHGVAEENVSAFPQAVTGEMVRNFASGGAAICVLARSIGASLEVMHLGTVNDPGPLPGVVRNIIASETANFSKQIAMDDAQLSLALDAGRAAVEGAKRAGKNIFIGGDMGIANTTSAAALVCAYLNMPAEQIAGPGTGLDQKGVNHKVDVINAALTLHQDHLVDPIKILRCMGGFEIVALSGAFIRAAQVGLPVVVDGFIASAAALAALKINPSSASWMLLSHVSAEPGYLPLQRVLESSTGCTPLFDLGLRLGEGSGAAVALPLIQNACALHCGMATFEQAGVSEG